MCLLGECSEMIRFSAPWPNIWPRGGLKMDQIWVFRIQCINLKRFHSFHFITLPVSVLGECSQIIRFSAQRPNIWPPCGLKMGQIWGFWTLSEKVFIQLIPSKPVQCAYWVSVQKFFHFLSCGQNFCPLLSVRQSNQQSTHLKGWCLLLDLGQSLETVPLLMPCLSIDKQSLIDVTVYTLAHTKCVALAWQ